MRLTKTAIDAIRPGPKSQLHWDAALTGFGLRVTSSGVKSFVVRYRVGKGRNAPERLDTIGRYGPLTAEQARAEAKKRLSMAALGQDPLGERRARMAELTVKGMLELWETSGALTNRRTGRTRGANNVAADIRRVKAHVLPRMATKRLSDVTKADVEALREAVRRGDIKYRLKTKPRGVQNIRGGDGAAIRTVATFRSALSWAVDQGFLKTNPAAGVKLPQPRRKIAPLTPEQFQSLSRALKDLEAEYPEAVQIIRLLALTGARKSEIEKLRWSEISPDWRSLRKGEAKTDARIIFLGAEAAAILENRTRQEGNPFVFPATRGDGYYQHMPKVWEKGLKRAGLPLTTRRHDLRHSFATYGAMDGVPSVLMQALLSHSSVTTTELYYHTSNPTVQNAAEQVEQRIAALLNGERPITPDAVDEPRAANDR